MKSRQVGFVLVGLIAIGLAGLVIRLVSAGSDEVVLSGLIPISQDAIDRVVIRSADQEAELRRFEQDWQVNNNTIFTPKLEQFWDAVDKMENGGALLVSENPAYHDRIGVTPEKATLVTFRIGGLDAETFLVGKWEPDVRLCYLRRQGRDEVYAIPCARPDVFDPDPDGWRNPIIVSIPRAEITAIEFIYPEETFSVRPVGPNNWVVTAADGSEQPADLAMVDFLLTIAEQRLIASGFASEEEAQGLNFEQPKAAVRFVTSPNSAFPTTRLRFLDRDDATYFVSTPADATVFILNKALGDAMLVTREDVVR
ncbi:MAG: DUF4340 domain-containing protein [Chloroflexi bacterium]|nr:DUF4340 domain-containing protein [Chloroflexota bacterium]